MNEKLIKDHPFGFMAVLSAVMLCIAAALMLIAPGTARCMPPFIAAFMVFGGLCAFF